MEPTQLENDKIKNAEWFIDFESINPRTSIHSDVEAPIITDDQLKWFQVVMPNTGDTPTEVKEKKEALNHQIEKGIIRVQQRPPTLNGAIPGINNNKKIEGTFIPDMSNAPQQNNVQRSSIVKKQKTGPNDPCPCGSKKKFKKCHGKGSFN